MKLEKTINTYADGRRVLNYTLDGEPYAQIIRRSNKKRFDVVFANKNITAIRGLKWRSQDEMNIIT